MRDLILLHGAIGSKEQFSGLKQLLKDSYNLHTFNFNGHGGREIPAEPFTIEMFADDIINYVKSNKLITADFFGYSMGGYAALYAAGKQPELFGKIFTIAVKFEWSPEIAAREVKMLDAENIKQKVPKFAEELAERHGADKWETVLKKTAAMIKELGNKNVLTAEIMKQINNKVLVGIGDSDKMVSLEETISAYRLLPNAKLLVMPGTPHHIEMINSSKLAGEINRFFV